MSQIPASGAPLDPHPSLDPLVDDRPHRPADDREEVYYEGSPHVRGELSKVAIYFIVGLVLIAIPFIWKFLQREHEFPGPWYITVGLILVGLLVIFIPYIAVKRVRYRITNYRIDFERGLLSKTIDTLELWHVEDIKFHQSMLERMLGVGSIAIISHDDTTPSLTLKGLPNPRVIFESLKQRIIAVKRQRGVVKMDVGT